MLVDALFDLVTDHDRNGWNDWIAGLDHATAARAEALCEVFVELGARDPGLRVRSEIGENLPQLARFVFLRAVWREVEEWRGIDTVPGLVGKASDEAIALALRVATQAAFHTALALIELIDDEEDVTSPGTPGWRLVECDAEGRPTGRVLGGLHESFLAADPRGLEATDILDG